MHTTMSRNQAHRCPRPTSPAGISTATHPCRSLQCHQTDQICFKT
jgi:hypothetical protein